MGFEVQNKELEKKLQVIASHSVRRFHQDTVFVSVYTYSVKGRALPYKVLTSCWM